jgi:hypothetical protein
MTEQPAEPITEQAFLGNEPRKQAYLPNGHRFRPDLAAATRYDIAKARIEELDRAAADIRVGKPVHAEPSAFAFMDEAAALELPALPAEPDLWLDTETTATRALNEIQNGNINSSIAYLQSALAFALNYRHSISTGVAGL